MANKIKRKRKVGSIKNELIKKSREAILAAVQIYNNPQITFKSETFITLVVIAWTYLLHAYYRGEGIDYRYYRKAGTRKRYDKTSKGAYKYWELERCINCGDCPLDHSTKNNLRFLIGIRHEIEHQMTRSIDEHISTKLQACAINYDHYLTTLFGCQHSVSDELAITIQFSKISPTQESQLSSTDNLTTNVRNYISEFENDLSEDEIKDLRYSYRILYVPISAKRRGQADSTVKFVKAGSDEAKKIEQILLKEIEKPKYLPGEIVEIMQNEGFKNFRIHDHTQYWKERDAKNPNKGYGVSISGQWYWYDNWLNCVRQYCNDNKKKFS